MGTKNSLKSNFEKDEIISIFVGLIFFVYLFFILFSRPENRGAFSSSIFGYGTKETLSVFESNVDEKGIPIIVNSERSREKYHSTYICRYAMYLSSKYMKQPEEEDLPKIRAVMEWISENKVNKVNYITWYHSENLDSFNLEAPWTSSMTNAFCAGALLHGYIILENKQLDIDARRALEYLFIPVEAGGGMHVFDDGDIWFEEAPSIENPSHILNGCIFAVDILDLFASYYKYPRYENHLDKVLISLRNRLSEYDADYGSIYDLYTKNNKLGMSYHRIHFVQLYYLYLRTGDDFFRNLSQKWYELHNQSDYKIIDASSTVENPLHGYDKLNDGLYWYRYWQATLPSNVTVEFNSLEKVKAIIFFGLSGGSPVENIEIYSENNKKYSKVPTNEYNVEYMDLNISGDSRTNVYMLRFNSDIETKGFRLVFEKDNEKEYVLLREIGFWKDMTDEHQTFMNNYSYFNNVIELR